MARWDIIVVGDWFESVNILGCGWGIIECADSWRRSCCLDFVGCPEEPPSMSTRGLLPDPEPGLYVNEGVLSLPDPAGGSWTISPFLLIECRLPSLSLSRSPVLISLLVLAYVRPSCL